MRLLYANILSYNNISIRKHSAGNGNLEKPVYFLKSKQGYTARKMEKDK
jgi:hypothetical protein